jgi:hypothetical protein
VSIRIGTRLRPDRAADLDAALPRQQDIEDDAVVLIRQGEAERLGPVRRLVDLVRRLPQSPGDGGEEVAIVFGEQQAHLNAEY